jgi:hypothetical protein
MTRTDKQTASGAGNSAPPDPKKRAPPLSLAWRGVYAALLGFHRDGGQAESRLDPELMNEILEEVARDSWRRS